MLLRVRSRRSTPRRRRKPLACLAVLAVLAAGAGACNALTGVSAFEVGEPTDPDVPDAAPGPQRDAETPRTDGRAPPPDATTVPTDAGDGGAPEGGPGFKRVFVTSTTFQGSLGGLAGADSLCTGLAAQASLGGAWVAWLSSKSVGAGSNARDRVTGTGPWRLVDGTPAVQRANLQGALPLQAAIRMNELGAMVPANTPVWTATRINGLADDNDCTAWSSAQFAVAGSVGAAGSTNSGWTSDDKGSCSDVAALYCFEQ